MNPRGIIFCIGGRKNLCGEFLGVGRSKAADLLSSCHDPDVRNKLSEKYLGRTLWCSLGRPSKFPRFAKFADDEKTLTKQQCTRSNRRSQRKRSTKTGKYFSGYAERWDDPGAEAEINRSPFLSLIRARGTDL